MDQDFQHKQHVGYRDGDNVVIHQSWRNMLGTLGLVLCVLGVTSYLTILFPEYTSVPLALGGFVFEFPVLNLVPLLLLARAAYVIYNERFVLTPHYLIHVTGRLAWRGRSSRLDYSKIQEIEIEETLLQRALGVGDLKIIPIAGTDSNSIRLQGVAYPRAVKDLVRDLSQRGHATV